MTENSTCPRAREDGLIVREMADEVLIYDTTCDRATALNPFAALVWAACDGVSDNAAITARLRAAGGSANTADDVDKALALLDKAHLLDRSAAAPASEIAAASRRKFIGRVGQTGLAAALAVPVITSILAPTPAQAATCLPSAAACTTGGQCCSGLCIGGGCA